MPRRRKSVAPLSDVAVLASQVEALRREMMQLKQPGPSSFQSDKMLTALDPIPWQVIINHPGEHIPATERDAAMYWHPGDVENPIGWKRLGGRVPPSNVYHLISAVGLNNHTILGSPGYVTGYYITNIAADFRYVKLYDKSSTPTVGTDIPKIVLGIPPVTAANIGFESFPEFDNGIGIGTTTGIADSSTAGVGLQELAVCIYYQ